MRKIDVRRCTFNIYGQGKKITALSFKPYSLKVIVLHYSPFGVLSCNKDGFQRERFHGCLNRLEGHIVLACTDFSAPRSTSEIINLHEQLKSTIREL